MAPAASAVHDHPVISSSVPVLGELTPWHRSPEFDSYDTGTVEGLARVTGRHLELVVITAKEPGHGQCGAFLRDCMAAYDRITVWEVMNPELEAMLAR